MEEQRDFLRQVFDALDQSYLLNWAKRLKLDDLLTRITTA
jgi:hypothetical protein